MTSRYSATDTDDASHFPERGGDRDEPGDTTRRLAPDSEDVEDEEDGYGYGV
jgi:hypothetical protein